MIQRSSIASSEEAPASVLGSRPVGQVGRLALGATATKDGVEFALFSRNAESVTLCLFDSATGPATAEIPLDPRANRFGDVWHVFVPGLRPGQIYGYRVEGPHAPNEGHRFDPSLVLLDPCGRATTSNLLPPERTHNVLMPDAPARLRSVVIDAAFDWQGVRPPRIPMQDTIIYEVHLRGFTRHESSGVARPGSYLGFIEMIPYLKDLGVTAVELLPIQEFDPHENTRRNPASGDLLVNYWGYSTIAFFAPQGWYSFSREPGAMVTEFKTLVRELHRAGIEVILDVVYNHTGEGNHHGPSIHFKGLDNSIYYYLTQDKQYYMDFSGCGNSVNGNHAVVRQFILQSLRYWVTEMHVDGFRFDLATVLSRDTIGRVVPNPPLIEAISEDPILRDAKLIAEAWDAVGGYQVGSFPGRFAEWNGRYRDDIRQYWRGDPGKTGVFATRLTGSSDLYQTSGRRPYYSINFITSHDGFTLADLVSYNGKHNEANGEDNRDGDNNNHSYNFGVEGPSTIPRLDRLRLRQVKNYLATLLLSQGVPMILGGDEFRRTQGGNNNAYCQDNSISWYDWKLLERHAELHRFTRGLIDFRRRHPSLRRTEFFKGQKIPGRAIADISWFRPDGKPKDWNEDDHTLVALMDGLPLRTGSNEEADDQILLLANASTRTVNFHLVAGDAKDRPWCLVFDTGNIHPRDLYGDGEGPIIPTGSLYPLIERSMACFIRPHS